MFRYWDILRLSIIWFCFMPYCGISEDFYTVKSENDWVMQMWVSLHIFSATVRRQVQMGEKDNWETQSLSISN